MRPNNGHFFSDLGVAWVLASCVTPALLLAAGAARVFEPSGWRALVAAAIFIAGVVGAYKLVGRHRARAHTITRVLVLVALPLWGLGYNHFLGHPTCTITSCAEGTTPMRAFVEPDVLGLAALHAITVLAYAVSRRRPGALRPLGEATVHAALVAGIALHAVVALHVARWSIVGVLITPVFLPCLGSLFTTVMYAAELHARLLRRGVEADAPPPRLAPDSPFRAGPLQEELAPDPRLHRPSILRALVTGPALLGVYAVGQALWIGRPAAGVDVFTATCGHVLSRIDVTVVPQDCHYLCTVAARGDAWLVKPERLGRRRGVVIVVNRQLAIANAFEDLLRDRWPAFGRLARRVYDRVGLPVSRYLRHPWLANLTYVAMKPAEWGFSLALLLLDPGDPEARIDRMYR